MKRRRHQSKHTYRVMRRRRERRERAARLRNALAIIESAQRVCGGYLPISAEDLWRHQDAGGAG